MIAILLNDDSFEQDIRELLMAFFSGGDVYPQGRGGRAGAPVLYGAQDRGEGRML